MTSTPHDHSQRTSPEQAQQSEERVTLDRQVTRKPAFLGGSAFAATRAHGGKTRKQSHITNPRAWDLWRRPKPMIVFVLTAEVVAVAGMIIAVVSSAVPISLDWIRFGILAVGATIHIQLTHRQEERRRNRIVAVHIDLTAVWIFPATVVLPIPLTLLLVLLIRIQRWFTARRPAHTFIFSSITHGFAATLAHGTFIALGGNDFAAGTGAGMLAEFAVLVATGVAYEAVQIVYISGILGLGGTTAPTVRNILGNTADNVLEVVTIGLGAVTAILLVNIPPAVAIMALVTVVFNRLAELDQLQADVRTDSKTGVFNMRGWSESAQRAMNRSGRAGGELALLMVDLDHFKWINDGFGHPAGDEVLHAVAQVLGDVTRPADVVGRFGGEEFLVLLPDTDATAAAAAAERIRYTIAGLHIVTTDKRGAQTTITNRTASVGIARYPRDAEDLPSLMQAADAAVYAAKENGRNQVRFAAQTATESATDADR